MKTFFSVGKAAENAFRNLRNKFGRERRKLKAVMKSGAGTNEVKVQLSAIFPYLAWLEPYFVERETGSNFEPEAPPHEDELMVPDVDSENAETSEHDKSPLASNEMPRVSAATGKVQYKKRSR